MCSPVVPYGAWLPYLHGPASCKQHNRYERPRHTHTHTHTHTQTHTHTYLLEKLVRRENDAGEAPPNNAADTLARNGKRSRESEEL